MNHGPDTPCREYRGPLNENGYGRRVFHRTDGGWCRMYVHRWVWEQVNGPIPPGLCVLHRCDNPPCFRYDHLFLGTRQENSADMVAKGRNTQHGIVCLPEESIILAYRQGWSLRRIAAYFHCSGEGVRDILLRHEVPRRTGSDPRPRW